MEMALNDFKALIARNASFVYPRSQENLARLLLVYVVTVGKVFSSSWTQSRCFSPVIDNLIPNNRQIVESAKQ